MIAKRLSLTLALLLVSSLGLSHWYSIRQIDSPPTEQRTTTYRCIDSTGITVATNQTFAASEQACGALATQRGGVFYIEEHDSIARVTRTHEVRGSISLKVTAADASMILVNGGNSGNSGPVEPFDLSLGGTRPVQFAYSWPDEPVITSEATVTNQSELEASAAVNGRKTIVASGTYTNIGALNGTDKWFDFQPGATVETDPGENFFIENFATRVKITGGTFDTGIRNWGPSNGGGTDLIIDGITADIPNGNGSFDLWDVQRMAIINSTIDSPNFVIFGLDTSEDFIIAGNEITAKSSTDQGRAALRITGPTRLIVVQNRIVQADTNTYHNFRTHDQGDYIHIVGNQFEGGTGAQGIRIHSSTGAGSHTHNNIWVYDNNAYAPTGWWVFDETNGLVTNVTADDNNFYSNFSSGQMFTDPGGQGWVIGDNPSPAYTTPPAWNP